ncbi:MAG TPA: hypothetical protein VIE68_05975 [Gemmatimonadota bacterium]
MPRSITLRLVAGALGASALSLPGFLFGQAAVTGYALNVGTWSGDSPLAEGGAADLQRFRLMAEPVLGPVRFDLAWDHLAILQRPAAVGAGLLSSEASASNGFDLDRDIVDRRDFRWSHSLDRIAATVAGRGVEATFGRQAISWATTLYLSPADPFAPFDPADPYREYRPGVDALRVRVFPGPLTEIETVLRISKTPDGRTWTALVRTRTSAGSVDLSGWGGVLHGEPAAAFAATLPVAGAAVRGELSVRREGDAALRAAIGADRRWTFAGRDLYAIVELQHDGFGAAQADDFARVLVSRPYRRGEMQTLGRDALAAQASWQAHPLVGVQWLTLWNLRDGSALHSPGVAVSATRWLDLRAGSFVSTGEDALDPVGQPGSEYGLVPPVLYVSAAAFF